MSAVRERAANVLQTLPARAAAEMLRAVNDHDAADLVDAAAAAGVEVEGMTFEDVADLDWPGRTHEKPAWASTNFVRGYVAPTDLRGRVIPIVDMGEVQGDESLIGARIGIRLSMLHVHSFPGGDTRHRLLASPFIFRRSTS
jgi:hypothetical protein